MPSKGKGPGLPGPNAGLAAHPLGGVAGALMVKPLSQSVMLLVPNAMHGPVGFVQTTSQLSLVFSVMTRVAGMTPQTLFENARSASPGPPLALSRADSVGVDVRESVHAALVSSATAQARRLAVLHVPVCITSPCRRGRSEEHTSELQSRLH